MSLMISRNSDNSGGLWEGKSTQSYNIGSRSPKNSLNHVQHASLVQVVELQEGSGRWLVVELEKRLLWQWASFGAMVEVKSRKCGGGVELTHSVKWRTL